MRWRNQRLYGSYSCNLSTLVDEFGESTELIKACSEPNAPSSLGSLPASLPHSNSLLSFILSLIPCANPSGPLGLDAALNSFARSPDFSTTVCSRSASTTPEQEGRVSEMVILQNSGRLSHLWEKERISGGEMRRKAKGLQLTPTPPSWSMGRRWDAESSKGAPRW